MSIYFLFKTTTRTKRNPSYLLKMMMAYHYVFHCVWIKDLSRLVSGQLSNRNHKHYICDRCLHHFRNKEKLIAHGIDCTKMNECSVTLPSPGNEKLKFKNFKHIEKVPFGFYADFECILKKSESTSGNTQITQIHEPCSQV